MVLLYIYIAAPLPKEKLKRHPGKNGIWNLMISATLWGWFFISLHEGCLLQEASSCCYVGTLLLSFYLHPHHHHTHLPTTFLSSTAFPRYRFPSMDSEQRKQSSHEDDERKQAQSRRLPHALLDEVHSDFALAMVLQEQERAFMALTSFESDSEEEESEEESYNEANDYEYFESHDFEAEQGFLGEEEGGGSDSDEEEDMEEDDIDLDEMTYEELIALGEFIGQEKKGLPTDQIPAFLHPCEYQSLESKAGIDRCVICQMEYEGGERLVALPCDHRYHSECIIKWLQINKICPICSSEVSSPRITRTA